MHMGSRSAEESDSELMARIVDRDVGAFQTLYHRYGPTVFGLCIRMVRNTSDAEDVLTEVFWEIWSKAERFNPERGSFRTYIMRLARSRAIDHLRVRCRREAVIPPLDTDLETSIRTSDCATEDGKGPLDEVVSREHRNGLARALRDLDEPTRKVVELSYFDGLTHTEIAELLRTPLGTVKSRIRQGVMRLRESIGRLYGKDHDA
jgi:RNA polymerase sigma-70 factor (ECF subfamily)